MNLIWRHSLGSWLVLFESQSDAFLFRFFVIVYRRTTCRDRITGSCWSIRSCSATLSRKRTWPLTSSRSSTCRTFNRTASLNVDTQPLPNLPSNPTASPQIRKKWRRRRKILIKIRRLTSLSARCLLLVVSFAEKKDKRLIKLMHAARYPERGPDQFGTPSDCQSMVQSSHPQYCTSDAITQFQPTPTVKEDESETQRNNILL